MHGKCARGTNHAQNYLQYGLLNISQLLVKPNGKILLTFQLNCS